MTGPLKIGRFRPEDLDVTLELLRHEYGDAEITDPDFLNWELFENPAGSALITISTRDGDSRILGIYVVNRMSVTIENEEILGSVAINLVVHPDARRQGLFTSLAEAAYQSCPEEGIAFTYGFPNPSALPGHTRKLNSPNIGEVPLYVRALKLKSILRAKGFGKLTSGIGTFAYRVFLALKSGFGRRSESLNELKISRINEFDNRFDRFWEEVQHKNYAWLTRSSAFLNWRYIRVPLRKYEVHVAESQDQVQAFLVTRIMDFQGMKCGMIVDFVSQESPHAEAASSNLIAHSLQLMEEQGVELSGCLMQPHTIEARLLRSYGFIQCPKRLLPQPFPVILRVHQQHERFAKLYDLKNWFLTMGDYDVI